MTRVPNFRAWDKADEDMANDVFFAWQDCGYESLNECLADDRWLFMQSTGIKDKNGTEIYEGDILKLDGLTGLFEVRRANSGLYKLFRRSTPYDLIKLIDWIGYVEVVGNVYENKEILE